MGGHKIDAHGVEDRLRAAHHNGGGVSKEGIGPVLFVEIQKESRGRRGGEHLNDGDRHQFSRKMKIGGQAAKKTGKKCEEAGCPEHADGYHQADQCWHDADNCLESIGSTFDEVIVDMLLPGKPKRYDVEDQQGNDGIGEKNQKVHIEAPLHILKLNICSGACMV